MSNERVRTTPISIGRTSRTRQLAAAGALLVGSVLMCGTTLGGLKLYQNVLVLGVIVVAAWLLDGTSQRYMGAGLGALATGLGLTVGTDLGLPAVEHGIVWPLVGLALLLIWKINPDAMVGAAGFLIIVGAVVWSFQAGVEYDGGWTLAGILAVWGIVQIVRILRTRQPASTDAPAGSPAQSDELTRTSS